MTDPYLWWTGLAVTLAALAGAAVLTGWLIALCLDERDRRREET